MTKAEAAQIQKQVGKLRADTITRLKAEALTRGWALTVQQLSPGNKTTEVLQVVIEDLHREFENRVASAREIGDLFREIRRRHTFVPDLAEVLEVWEDVRLHRTHSERPVDPETLPEEERPL